MQRSEIEPMCLACAVFNPFQTEGNWLHESSLENALAITESTDAAGNTSTSYTMAPGDSFSGALTFDNDWDWVRVNMTAGVTYTFTMTAGSMQDPYLYLFDGSGSFLTSNDDFSGLNSQISYTPTSSGTFYIAADSYYNSSGYTGTFVIPAPIP